MKTLFYTFVIALLCSSSTFAMDDTDKNKPAKVVKLNASKYHKDHNAKSTPKTTKSTATKKPTAKFRSKTVSKVLPRLKRSDIEGAGKVAAKDIVANNKTLKLNTTPQPKSILKKPSLANQASQVKPNTTTTGNSKLNSQLTARKPQTGTGAKVTFNKKVEVKKIPNKPTKNLSSSKTAKLKKPNLPSSIAGQANGKRPDSLRGQKPDAAKSKTSKLSSTTGKSSKLKGAKKLTVGKVAGAGLILGGAASLGDTKKMKDSGKLTKSQYNKAQATNITKIGGEALKLKKLNPTALLMNDTLGTDPISLGVEGIGDLINGTDNAKQSLKGVKSAWNESLTKQTFTDPKGAAKRVGNNLKQAGNDVKKFGQKTGQNLDKASKAVGKEAKKVTNNVKKGVNKAKNAVGKAGKETGDFIKGVFKKKKK